VVRNGVIPGYSIMCEKCKEAYKSSQEFPWWKWKEMNREAKI
jgi:hypothetical protein